MSAPQASAAAQSEGVSTRQGPSTIREKRNARVRGCARTAPMLSAARALQAMFTMVSGRASARTPAPEQCDAREYAVRERRAPQQRVCPGPLLRPESARGAPHPRQPERRGACRERCFARPQSASERPDHRHQLLCRDGHRSEGARRPPERRERVSARLHRDEPVQWLPHVPASPHSAFPSRPRALANSLASRSRIVSIDRARSRYPS